jgi:uncharacterized protein YjaG (DUF416 family)
LEIDGSVKREYIVIDGCDSLRWLHPRVDGDTTVKITVCKKESVTTLAAYEEKLRGMS